MTYVDGTESNTQHGGRQPHGDRTPQQGDNQMDDITIMRNFQNMADAMNANASVFGDTLDALISVLGTEIPGFQAKLDKAVFMKRCINVMEAKDQLLVSGHPDALVQLSETNKMLDLLKAEAKEKGWQSTFNGVHQKVEKAKRDAKGTVLEVVK